MSSWPRTWLWVFGLPACHETTSLSDPPPAATSVVMIGDSGGQPKRVWVTDGSELPPAFSANTPQVVAAGFRCSPVDLGLEPGAVTLEDKPVGLRIPPPSSLWELQADTWASVSESPLATRVLESLPLPATHACDISLPRYDNQGPRARFDPTLDGISLNWARPYGEEILVGTETGTMYALDESLQQRPIPASDPLMPTNSAYLRPNGDFAGIAADGMLIQGRLGEPMEIVRAVLSTSALSRMEIDGPGDDSPFELFAVGDRLNFEHYDATAKEWTLLTKGTRSFMGVFHPSVAWVGPGEAIAVGPTESESAIAWARNGEVTELLLPLDAGAARLVQRTETLGVLVLGSTGEIYRFDAGELVPFANAPSAFAESDYQILPIPGGIALVRLGESPGAYVVASFGHCPLDLFSTRVAAQIVPYKGGFFVGHRSYLPVAEAFASFVRLTRPTPECLLSAERN